MESSAGSSGSRGGSGGGGSGDGSGDAGVVVGAAVSEYDGRWNLDVIAIEDWAQQCGLQFVSHCVFSSYGFFFEGEGSSGGGQLGSGLGLSRTLLPAFLEAIESGYNLCHNPALGGQRNPYHNSMHAASALVDVQYFLRQGQLLLLPSMQPWEVLAMVFAALVHDYRHPATSNNFEAATLSERAMVYNDIRYIQWYSIARYHSITNIVLNTAQ
jgi:hypothetical protein